MLQLTSYAAALQDSNVGNIHLVWSIPYINFIVTIAFLRGVNFKIERYLEDHHHQSYVIHEIYLHEICVPEIPSVDGLHNDITSF